MLQNVPKNSHCWLQYELSVELNETLRDSIRNFYYQLSAAYKNLKQYFGFKIGKRIRRLNGRRLLKMGCLASSKLTENPFCEFIRVEDIDFGTVDCSLSNVPRCMSVSVAFPSNIKWI